MSVSSELSRLRRDIASLAEEIAVNTGPKAKAPLSQAERRTLKGEMQRLIQTLDELGERLN
jgi:hypothetical protein